MSFYTATACLSLRGDSTQTDVFLSDRRDALLRCHKACLLEQCRLEDAKHNSMFSEQTQNALHLRHMNKTDECNQLEKELEVVTLTLEKELTATDATSLKK